MYKFFVLFFLIRFADDHGMPLFETSAKDDSKADHVDAIFLTLAHKVRNNKTLFKSGNEYSKHPKTGHPNTGNMRKLNLCVRN